MNRSSKPTLVEIARAAGVSRSTASNAFSHPERVRADVRERVAAAALAHGYLGPDPKGRLLRAGKVNAIGVITPRSWGIAHTLRNPVLQLFLHGVGEACDEAGASLVIMSDKTGPDGIKTALVDGFILSRIEQMTEIEPARLRRLPFAVLDVDAGPDVSSVRVDARTGCYAAARHLLDLGHRRFGIVSFLRDFGPPRYHPAGERRSPDMAGMPIDEEKLHGYAAALAEAGIDIATVPIVQAHPWEDNAAKLMLDVAPGATGFLSMSAMQGIAIINEATRRGLEVPRDLSVVGFNDIPEAALAKPPLTTIDGMSVEKGRAAARIVFEAGPPRRELIQTRLLMRASTAPPPPTGI